MPTRKPLQIGERFSRLTVVAESEPRVFACGRVYRYRVRCDCGNELDVAQGHLRNGVTRSCGCLQREAVVRKNTTHGATHSSCYRSWQHMRERCHDPDDPGYRNYGGRGISVCDEWRNDFGKFFADMGPRPPNTSLDRINNDGNYEPGNCRWATRQVQNSNQRKNVFVTLRGERVHLSEACRRLDVSTGTLKTRRSRYGESPQEAVDHYVEHGKAR